MLVKKLSTEAEEKALPKGWLQTTWNSMLQKQSQWTAEDEADNEASCNDGSSEDDNEDEDEAAKQDPADLLSPSHFVPTMASISSPDEIRSASLPVDSCPSSPRSRLRKHSQMEYGEKRNTKEGNEGFSHEEHVNFNKQPQRDVEDDNNSTDSDDLDLDENGKQIINKYREVLGDEWNPEYRKDYMKMNVDTSRWGLSYEKM